MPPDTLRYYCSRCGNPLNDKFHLCPKCGALESGHPEPAMKHDHGKPRYDLIPPEVMEAMATVLAHGLEKYEPRDWEKGTAWGKYFRALQGHLWDWWRGKDTDPDSGLSALWHAAACLSFLIAYEARGVGEDDRPGKGKGDD